MWIDKRILHIYWKDHATNEDQRLASEFPRKMSRESRLENMTVPGERLLLNKKIRMFKEISFCTFLE